jgi:hypothetical protein
MIETPVKAPPPSGPPSAPPPDARTRVMDPPPDPGGRHEHACVECGAPLHADQAACLSCGAMVELGEGGAGIRRAALGSVTALLVLGAAVGAAVAGLPHGKKVPKAVVAQTFGGPKKAIPPATADSGTGTGSGATTPLPGGGSGSTPPPITHSHTRQHVGPVTNPHSTGGSTTGGSTSGGTTGGSSDTGGSTKHGSSSTASDDSHHGGKPPPPTLWNTGEQPAAAGVFDSSPHPGAGKSDNTIDSDAASAWTTKGTGIGVYVDVNPGSYKKIGVISETPGYGAFVYYSTADDPPATLALWSPVGSTSAAGFKKRFALKGEARNAKHYLVRITDQPAKGSVSLNEIQLFQ